MDRQMTEMRMFRDARLWCAVAGFGIAVWLLAPQLRGGRPPRVGAEDMPVMEYICGETKEVFRLAATGPRLANPKTGRLTLVPAVYDPRKKVWKQGPPLDIRQAGKARRG
jgi:hypothetical protein